MLTLMPEQAQLEVLVVADQIRTLLEHLLLVGPETHHLHLQRKEPTAVLQHQQV